jgi:hypothetical protein
MSESVWAMLMYFLLQAASLALLPGWWKLAAAPALLPVPMIVSEWRQPSYMGDVITAMAAIYACGYLTFVWAAFGMTKLVQRFRRMKHRGTEDTEI